MKRCVIIPARYQSSRYPGKPLVRLLGKPMILWVAELSAKAVGKAHVYVATDDERIVDVVEKAGFSAIMTGSDAPTGTDRLAEAAETLDYDIYLNVQGDEPLVQPVDINRVADRKEQEPHAIVNAYCYLAATEDPSNRNIPKIVATEDDTLIYMSRAALPAYKDLLNAPQRYKKQVCIYAFNKRELKDFRAFGRKSHVEACEDIEILRFLDLSRKIVLVEASPGSLAVDVPEDVAPVETALEARRE